MTLPSTYSGRPFSTSQRHVIPPSTLGSPSPTNYLREGRLFDETGAIIVTYGEGVHREARSAYDRTGAVNVDEKRLLNHLRGDVCHTGHALTYSKRTSIENPTPEEDTDRRHSIPTPKQCQFRRRLRQNNRPRQGIKLVETIPQYRQVYRFREVLNVPMLLHTQVDQHESNRHGIEPLHEQEQQSPSR